MGLFCFVLFCFALPRGACGGVESGWMVWLMQDPLVERGWARVECELDVVGSDIFDGCEC